MLNVLCFLLCFAPHDKKQSNGENVHLREEKVCLKSFVLKQ